MAVVSSAANYMQQVGANPLASGPVTVAGPVTTSQQVLANGATQTTTTQQYTTTSTQGPVSAYETSTVKYGTTGGAAYGASAGYSTAQRSAVTTQYNQGAAFTGGMQYGAGTTTTQYGAKTYGTAGAAYSTAGSVYGTNEAVRGVTTHSTTGQEYEKSRQIVSSNIVSEQLMGDVPKMDGVRYVEIPVVQEVVKHVPVQEVVERVKHVPKVEVEYVDRVVEVPQVQWVDKQVEKVEVQEVLRHVPKKQVVDVPKEVVRHVPKVETVVVEKVVEVPGGVIEVPKPYTVENKIPVTHYNEQQVPVVVAQTVRPYVVESAHDVVDAEITEYEPQIIPVDVHISKPVAAQLVAVGMREQFHRVVDVPAAQYNTLVKVMNARITDETQLPYIREGAHVPLLNTAEFQNLVFPGPEVHIEGYRGAAVVHAHGASRISQTARGTQYSNYGAAGAYQTGYQAGYGNSGATYTTGVVTGRDIPMATSRSVASHSERHHGHHGHHAHSNTNGASAAQTDVKIQKKKVCC